MRIQLLVCQWARVVRFFLFVIDAGAQTPNQVMGRGGHQRGSFDWFFQNVQRGTLVKRRFMGRTGDLGLQLGDLEGVNLGLPPATHFG